MSHRIQTEPSSSYRGSRSGFPLPDNASFHSMTSKSTTYQPPTHHLSGQQQYRDPEMREDDEEFAAFAKALLLKQASYKYPPRHVIFNILSEEERINFAESYRFRLKELPLSIYPESGELPIVSLVREVREVFGPALMQVPTREKHVSDGEKRDAHSDWDEGDARNKNATNGTGENHQKHRHYDMEDRDSHDATGANRPAMPNVYHQRRDYSGGDYDDGEMQNAQSARNKHARRHANGVNESPHQNQCQYDPKEERDSFDDVRGGSYYPPKPNVYQKRNGYYYDGESQDVQPPARKESSRRHAWDMDKLPSHNHRHYDIEEDSLDGVDGASNDPHSNGRRADHTVAGYYEHDYLGSLSRDVSKGPQKFGERHDDGAKTPKIRRERQGQSNSFEISVPRRIERVQSHHTTNSKLGRDEFRATDEDFSVQPQLPLFEGDANSRIRSKGMDAQVTSVICDDESDSLTDTISLEDAKAIQTQSKVRQQLMEEIDHSRELLQRAANKNERSLYENHLRQLKAELENLNKSFSLEKPEQVHRHADKVTDTKLHPYDDRDRRIASKKVAHTVKVLAPENLPENYTFEAQLGDESFLATVPKGGVKKGEIFSTVMGDTAKTINGTASIEIPMRRWRDELFDCMNDGPLHPLFWFSWFCPQIAVAQIMARLGLTSPSMDGSALKSRIDVKTVILLTISFYILNAMLVYVIARGPSVPLLLMCLIPIIIVDIGVISCFFFFAIKTRKNIRTTYAIPESRCIGYEDEFVVICCTSCAVSQMGRHTADFSTYRASCCTETGLPDHVEVNFQQMQSAR